MATVTLVSQAHQLSVSGRESARLLGAAYLVLSRARRRTSE